MNKFNIFTFALGVAIGSIGAWYYTKNKYDKFIQTEIDSVKEEFSKRQTQDHGKMQYTQNAKSLSEKGYSLDNEKDNRVLKSDKNNKQKTKIEYDKYTIKGDKMYDEPYVISVEEFGEVEDYDVVSLIYYSGDSILSDDLDEIVEYFEEIVGDDYQYYFDEAGAESVYIRNDRLKCDYEITKDIRSYKDVVGYDLEGDE